jgi:hypothetical protein
MRLPLAAVTVLLTLVLSASAQAWTPKVWQTSLDIARMSWPDSPCTGREQITVTDDLPVNINGDAYQDGSCRVDIRAGLSDFGFCVVMVHEFGHLAGREHTDIYDHEGVMGPEPVFYSPCNVVAPRDSPRAAAAAMFSISPARCRLATATATRRLYRCGRRAHALVTLSAGLVLAIDRV